MTIIKKTESSRLSNSDLEAQIALLNDGVLNLELHQEKLSNGNIEYMVSRDNSLIFRGTLREVHIFLKGMLYYKKGREKSGVYKIVVRRESEHRHLNRDLHYTVCVNEAVNSSSAEVSVTISSKLPGSPNRLYREDVKVTPFLMNLSKLAFKNEKEILDFVYYLEDTKKIPEDYKTHRDSIGEPYGRIKVSLKKFEYIGKM